MVIELPTPEATEALGVSLASLAAAGCVFALSGPLGAGKTCVARGLIRALQPQADEEIVSPTFTLVQTYETPRGVVWHFDLYRLKHPDEILELGLDDALRDICVIEWPERLGPLLPPGRIDVTLAQSGVGRVADIEGRGRWARAVEAWKTDFENNGGPVA
jgi:tRNA threonylcarbamoyladenosine biosynthesis protein TsaE